MKKKISRLAVSAAFALGLFSAGAAITDDAAAQQQSDWSGFYIGAHVGAGFADIDWNRGPNFPSDVKVSGFMGGLLAGYNFQMDNIVFGLEGDVSFGDVDKTGVFPGSALPATLDANLSTTIRARLGYAFDNILLFATAGVGFIEVDVNDTATIAPQKESKTHMGFILGGGVETKLGNLFGLGDGLIGRLEYLYGDYGKKNYVLGLIPDPLKLQTHAVRAALIWQFH